MPRGGEKLCHLAQQQQGLRGARNDIVWRLAWLEKNPAFFLLFPCVDSNSRPPPYSHACAKPTLPIPLYFIFKGIPLPISKIALNLEIFGYLQLFPQPKIY